MKYRNWEVTRIKNNAYKATKGDNSMNACSMEMLKAMINEQEGFPIHKPDEKLRNDARFKPPSKNKMEEVFKRVLKNKKS